MNRRNVVAAFCRAHYGGILTAAGRWEEAETELLAASSRFERGVSTRREAALIRLGDLRVRQGRLEEATELLTGLEAHPEAVRALAGLYFARGEAARAREVLERATGGPDDEVPEVGESTMVGPLLALLVDVHLAEGSIDAAAQAAARLSRIADAQGGAYLRAAAALADGQVPAAVTASGGAKGTSDTPIPKSATASPASRMTRCQTTACWSLMPTTISPVSPAPCWRTW